jgi:hypothetical protein
MNNPYHHHMLDFLPGNVLVLANLNLISFTHGNIGKDFRKKNQKRCMPFR